MSIKWLRVEVTPSIVERRRATKSATFFKDNLNFTAHYGNLKADEVDAGKVTMNTITVAGDELKQQEIYGQLTYKMSKNLSTYVRYGTFEEKINSEKTVDQDAGRLQVAYTF